VAPEILEKVPEEQPGLALLQRSHWYLYVKPVSPVHVPLVVVRVWPTLPVPETTGATVLTGVPADMSAVPLLVAIFVPAETVVPVALMTSFSETLTSAS